MNLPTKRIESIDLLRGVIMVIMALDHVRDYFYFGAFTNDPLNFNTTTTAFFLTRFVTHYCAPIFIFLAGTSAFFYGRTKTPAELSRFLLTRGLWLIFMDAAIMPWLWFSNPGYEFVALQVLWAIGFSMIVLSGISRLSFNTILGFGLLLVFAHNLLDPIRREGSDFLSMVWYLLHQQNFMFFGGHFGLGIIYPVVPWIGVMALGYCFGKIYTAEFDPTRRKKWLLRLGLGAIGLFIVLRGINGYGDSNPWSTQKDGIFTLLSFINVSKYPPSLDFLLITLGPAFLFLYVMENAKGRISEFFLVYGRVPFFYYVLHVIVIHAAAFIGLALAGKDLNVMIINIMSFGNNQFANYGYSLGVVYAVWAGIVLLLYPFCRMYMNYKASHKEKWWLSYL